jgi:hypothetical protein
MKQVTKRGSTLFLRTVIVFFGLAVAALCIFLLSELFTQDLGGYFPIVIGMLIAAIPFFIGVYQTLKLLNYIDKNNTFSIASISTLNKIKYCGAAISALYAVGMPYIFIVADRDDAPGVVLLGLIFTFAPMAVAVFAAVLQNLLQNAMNLKSENELTV